MKRVIITLLLTSFFGFSQSFAQSNSSCEYNFPVKVKGSFLVLNDGTDRRFFLSGMVDNDKSSGMQLSKFNKSLTQQQMKDAKAMGANAVRWNAFLKGLDFEWDANGNVTGLRPNCFNNLKTGLDLAYQNGLMVQVVLSTAHFLKYGWGGEDNVIGGIRNGDRVNNNYKMMTTDYGIQNYINKVINPMCTKIGTHPALLGFVIINEAYGMTSSQDVPYGSWSDKTIRLNTLRKFVNRVSGALHRNLPGVICSVSGTAELIYQYNNSSLVYHGGDSDGTLDINQIQYYPNSHNTANSPFSNGMWKLRPDWGFDYKPTIAGEFPIDGIAATSKNSDAFTLLEAYKALWKGNYSGGFTWSNVDYYNASQSKQNTIKNAYSSFNNSYLSKLDPWENWDENMCNTVTSLSVQNLTAEEITVYPNPTTGIVNLSQKVNYKVYNSFGAQILSGYGKQIDITKFQKGIYYVHFNGTSKRISKQ
ncbi:T9SS type A sorting domain-containing protein [Flammeovirga sp. OC4]|uniref:T9SS type A sorting domain-containing protein n=1 Tax=Flammeovirga sp. OC4 TaxID=1382345 RepID=UPI00155DD625|nr:T9SS type A sorting domain-containing protein [Flammeovirga sp. OC4]